MEMENYKIVLRVGSREEYLKVLDFEFGRWCVTLAGAADDEAFLAFVRLIIDERNKGNLSIWSMALYDDPWGFDEEIVV